MNETPNTDAARFEPRRINVTCLKIQTAKDTLCLAAYVTSFSASPADKIFKAAL